jgi:hypothetical protein
MIRRDITRNELIQEITQEFPLGKGVEVGTFKGQFSKEILEKKSII